MHKNRKLPREGVAEREDDGLNVDGTDTDTEAHGYTGDDGVNRLPGTGGDAISRLPGTGGDAFPRRPSSGGELVDDDDVEGHMISSTHGPGTGGDAYPRRPSSGGELGDDAEGRRP